VRGLLIDAVQPAFDAGLPWRRARSVAVRPEPFGALVYHFGNRKLSFLKSRTLAAVVESLGDHPTAPATLAACGVPDAQRPAYEKALADLARSQMIEPRPSPPATVEGTRLPPRALRGGPGTGPGSCGEADRSEEP
jgi:putative mycofactocin binding protein MftB